MQQMPGRDAYLDGLLGVAFLSAPITQSELSIWGTDMRLSTMVSAIRTSTQPQALNFPL